jgi:hypothetical protein
MPERRFGTERGRHPVGRFGLVPRDDLIAYVFGDAEADGISLQRLATDLAVPYAGRRMQAERGDGAACGLPRGVRQPYSDWAC